MFGQHQWFKSRAGKLALRPRTWHGWLYLAAWVLVALLPGRMLVARHLTPEAILWVATAVTAFVWDLHCMRRQASEPLDVHEIFVIDERGGRLERQNV